MALGIRARKTRILAEIVMPMFPSVIDHEILVFLIANPSEAAKLLFTFFKVPTVTSFKIRISKHIKALSF